VGIAISCLHVVGLHEPPRNTPAPEEGFGIPGRMAIRLLRWMMDWQAVARTGRMGGGRRGARREVQRVESVMRG
jgi:hypothetical protein